MQKRLISLCIALILAVVLIIAAATIHAENDIPTRPPQTSATESATLDELPMFTLREYGGKLAVFSGNNTVPDEIYDDVLVDSLPPLDQELLRKGIPVFSRLELVKAIEDYTS